MEGEMKGKGAYLKLGEESIAVKVMDAKVKGRTPPRAQ